MNIDKLSKTLYFNQSRILPILDQTQGKEGTLPKLNHRLGLVVKHKRKIFPVTSIE